MWKIEERSEQNFGESWKQWKQPIEGRPGFILAYKEWIFILFENATNLAGINNEINESALNLFINRSYFDSSNKDG
jgi:hypothetical protein